MVRIMYTQHVRIQGGGPASPLFELSYRHGNKKNDKDEIGNILLKQIFTSFVISALSYATVSFDFS